MVGIASCPDLDALSKNPYWLILKEDIEKQGYTNEKNGSLRLSWLWAERKKIRILHFHYVQQFYAYKQTKVRLDWVLRLGRNLVLAKLMGYKIVFTLHNLTPSYPLKPGWVDYLGHWLTIQIANRVIVHCEEASRLLKKKYGRSRQVKIVPHPSFTGIYLNTIHKEEARKRLELGIEQFVFLYFGGIRPNKGVEELIYAFKKINGNELRLLIAGKPQLDPKNLERLIESAHEDDRIRLYLEFVPDENIQVYFNAADVVVLPFSKVLTSSSAMLALTFGKPVIAPAMGCLPELIGNAGWVYKNNGNNALVKVMNAVIHEGYSEKYRAADNMVGKSRYSGMAMDIYGDL